MNTMIKGNTKLYCVIGNPIEHSISPQIHNSIFEKLENNSIYLPLNIKRENLQESVGVFKNSFKGFNVTIPHKQDIINYLDELDEQASIYGAVNTVKVQDGRLIGYNTDGYGFSKGLEINNIDVKEKSILLLGAGGAARVVAYELINKGASLTIATRDEKKAKNLIKDLENIFGKNSSSYEDINKVKAGYFGIVNATPVGMAPQVDAIPINEDVLKGTEFVFDLIYNPYKTKLIEVGESYGAKGINGMVMLFYQAVRAQEIWKGYTLEDSKTLPIYEEVEKYLKTI